MNYEIEMKDKSTLAYKVEKEARIRVYEAGINVNYKASVILLAYENEACSGHECSRLNASAENYDEFKVKLSELLEKADKTLNDLRNIVTWLRQEGFTVTLEVLD